VRLQEDNEIDRLIAEHSNWGRWGGDDELGTLNLISRDTVLRAASAIKEGLTVTCGRTLSPSGSLNSERPMMHMMTISGEGAPQIGRGWASDWIGMEFHGYGVSHLDALSHQFWNGTMYNGVPANRVTTARGAYFGSVDAARNGIATRGVLLDLPRAFNVPWIEPADPISCEMLYECERRLGMEVEPGDALLVRTGRDMRSKSIKTAGRAVTDYAGLSGDCVRFLAERDVSLLVCDGMQDIVSADKSVANNFPIHVASLVGLGLWLLDNAYLEDLASECSRLSRSSFQFSLGPLRILYGTGSPVNPIAVL
jgi:kynurenine formamidase